MRDGGTEALVYPPSVSILIAVIPVPIGDHRCQLIPLHEGEHLHRPHPGNIIFSILFHTHLFVIVYHKMCHAIPLHPVVIMLDGGSAVQS